MSGLAVSFTKEFHCPALLGQEMVGGLQTAINKLVCMLLHRKENKNASGLEH